MRSDSKPIEGILGILESYLSQPLPESGDHFTQLVDEFEKTLSDPQNIAYIESHPELVERIRKVNAGIIDVYAATLSSMTSELYNELKFDQYKDMTTDAIANDCQDLINLALYQNELVRNHILSVENKDQRNLVIERYIFLVKQLLDKRDFFSARAIYEALNFNEIKRLFSDLSSEGTVTKYEWKGLSPEAIETMRYLETLFSQDKESKEKLRALVEDSKEPSLIGINKVTQIIDMDYKSQCEPHELEIINLDDSLKLIDKIVASTNEDDIDKYKKMLKDGIEISIAKLMDGKKALMEKSPLPTGDIEEIEKRIARLESSLKADFNFKNPPDVNQLKDAIRHEIAVQKQFIVEKKEIAAQKLANALQGTYQGYQIDGSKVSPSLIGKMKAKHISDWVRTKQLPSDIQMINSLYENKMSRADHRDSADKTFSLIQNIRDQLVKVNEKYKPHKYEDMISTLIQKIDELIKTLKDSEGNVVKDIRDRVGKDIKSELAQPLYDLYIAIKSDAAKYEKQFDPISYTHRKRIEGETRDKSYDEKITPSTLTKTMPTLSTPKKPIYDIASALFSYQTKLRKRVKNSPDDEVAKARLKELERISDALFHKKMSPDEQRDFLKNEIENNPHLKRHHTERPVGMLKEFRQDDTRAIKKLRQAYDKLSRITVKGMQENVSKRLQALQDYEKTLEGRNDSPLSQQRKKDLSPILTVLSSNKLSNQAKLAYLNNILKKQEPVSLFSEHHKSISGRAKKVAGKEARAAKLLKSYRDDLEALLKLEKSQQPSLTARALPVVPLPQIQKSVESLLERIPTINLGPHEDQIAMKNVVLGMQRIGNELQQANDLPSLLRLKDMIEKLKSDYETFYAEGEVKLGQPRDQGERERDWNRNMPIEKEMKHLMKFIDDKEKTLLHHKEMHETQTPNIRSPEKASFPKMGIFGATKATHRATSLQSSVSDDLGQHGGPARSKK